MAIELETKVEGDLLSVRAWGKDDSVEDVIAYGMKIIETASAHDTRKILCDERELIYAIKSFDIFEAATTIADFAPRVARVALVVNPHQVEDAVFYETVAVNRGLNVRVFKTVADARVWLDREM